MRMAWLAPVVLVAAGLLMLYLSYSRKPEVTPGDDQAVEEKQPVQSRAAPLIPLPPNLAAVREGQTVAQRMADASRSTRIRLAFVEQDSLRRFDFNVDVVDGVAVLNGTVQTAHQHDLAGQIAGRQEGIRGVVNQIVAPVRPALPGAEPAPLTAPPGAPPKVEPIAASPGAPTTQPPVAGKEDKSNYHTVRAGDSVWDIAQQHHVTVEHLKRLNGRTIDRIKPGQRIRIR